MSYMQGLEARAWLENSVEISQKLYFIPLGRFVFDGYR